MSGSATRFVSERRVALDLEPPELWESIADTAAYTEWWPWLIAFEPVTLARGARARCAIRSPLPYTVRLNLAVRDLDVERWITVDVTGDLAGEVSLIIEPAPHGSVVRVHVALDVHRPALRAATRVARPVLKWGHEWVLDHAIAQFGRARRPHRRSDVVVAAAFAGVVSGAPSTVLTRSPITTTRAAGALLGKPSVARGLIAHGTLSLGWTAVLARVLPLRRPITEGAIAGAAIAALDLGVIGKRVPAIRALPQGAQWADHIVFGATVGAVLSARRSAGAGARARAAPHPQTAPLAPVRVDPSTPAPAVTIRDRR